MTPEERFERIEEDLKIASGIIVRVSDRLDRAVRLAVREARNERRKRRGLDERLDKLAGTVQAFIDARRNGGNGHT